MLPRPATLIDRSTLAVRVPLAIAVLTALSACTSSAPPSPAPAPAANAVTGPTVSQTCPDASDGPSIVVQAIEDARRAMAANPSGPVPPVCLVTAFARISVVVPDSLTEHALGIAAELDRRGPNQRELLASEITLLGRARRFSDVARAYDRLASIDPAPPLEVTLLGIVAAHHTADTTGLLRLLSAAQSRPNAPPVIKTELNVLRQTNALRAAVNEGRGFIRQNPKYLAAYPSLVGNFGTLGYSDSVTAYIGRALRQGVARATLAPALDPYVNTMLRHSALYGGSDGWDAQIAAATRVDAALSSPSTKFLVASLIVRANESQIAELASVIDGASLGAVVPGTARSVGSPERAAGCQRIAPLMASLDVAAARVRDGGDRFGGPGVSQLSGALAAERERLTTLRDACARNP